MDGRVITVLLVDDQPQVLRGLAMRLALEPDVIVVGAATDGATALDLTGRLHPDVVVIDVELPGVDGIAVTATLAATADAPRVVVLTLHDDARTAARAKAAGASAFVAKHDMERPLLAAIRQAAD
jgi:DNA-binding NarL/FixJ family response regulator